MAVNDKGGKAVAGKLKQMLICGSVWGWLAVLITALIPVFASKQLVSLLTLAAILGIAVLGMDILMGFTGLLSLGQAGFMAIGAYTSGILIVRYNVPPIFALLAAQAITVFLSLLIGKAVLRLKGYHLAIATLAFSVIVEQVLINSRELTGGPSGLAGIPFFSVGGTVIPSGLPLYFLVMVILFILVILLKNLTSVRVGRAWLAISGDELAGSMLGVNTSHYKLLAFVIAACLAGLSGSLYVHYMRFISPDMVGMQASINITVMTALGGAGTLWGPLLGVGLMTFLPDLLSFTQKYQLIINGLVLFVTIVFFPKGISGLLKLLHSGLVRIILRPGILKEGE